jgi:osmotically-inducible protein OsmY
VTYLLAAERAARVAMTVKGVRAVINDIGTKSGGASDSQIMADVQEALHKDPLADADRIRVEVRDANVFVFGTVDSWQGKSWSPMR